MSKVLNRAQGSSPDDDVRGVQKAAPYGPLLASRELHPENHVIQLPGGIQLGGRDVVLMAGPCAVEDLDQLERSAEVVRANGARVLRGGAFKPRTSPYSFQGHGRRGLEMLRTVADRLGMAVVTEVLAPEDVPLVAEFADMLQIGARNMANYRLLEAAGRSGRPVLLKRGLAATIDELLLAAEYVLAEGNRDVALCERGIRTFETATRFTMDINAVPLLKQRSPLPVVLDPSHGTGDAKLVRPIARAGVAAGADALLIEVHPNPSEAMCDGSQSLDPAGFAQMASEVARIAAALDRGIG
jgi:3-deoxy-7-phosphoheptulonate synthase